MNEVNEKKRKTEKCSQQAPSVSLLFIYLSVNDSFFGIHDHVRSHVSADVPELSNDASFNYNDIFFFLAGPCAGDGLPGLIDQWLECDFQSWSCAAAKIRGGGDDGG